MLVRHERETCERFGVHGEATAIFGFGFTPWQAIQELIANQGLGADGIALIGYAAAYTFPAIAGFTVLFLLINRGWPPINGHLRIALFIVIFVITASVSEDYGLGHPDLHASRRSPDAATTELDLYDDLKA